MKVILAVLLPRLLFELEPDGPVYKRKMTITMRSDPPINLLVSLVEQ